MASLPDNIFPPAKPAWVDGRITPYIIAEAGVNHNGRRSTALELVDAAWSVGADCVKFQAYSTDELVVIGAEKAPYQKACGRAGESQFDMLLRCELTEDDFDAIMQHCKKRGIDFLVTPFSPRWVNVFVEFGVQAFKIGSGNLGAPLLLQAIAQSHLPVMVSTGMSDLAEVQKTLNLLEQNCCGDIALMHCVSLYPTKLDQINLFTVNALSQYTGLPVGFSDHTEELFTGGLAVAAGACILEKHFTLDRNQDGPDHALSLNPDQLREYIAHAHLARRACGQKEKQPAPQEQSIKDAVRMSVVSTVRIEAGATLTREMLTEKRPGTGIPAEDLEKLIGLTTGCVINANQVIRPCDIPGYQACKDQNKNQMTGW